MLNQVILVGRLVKKPQVEKTENGKDYANITLAVSRSFKNEEGIYETDFINCTLWEGVAIQTSNYCKSGDIIGVRGRLEKIKDKVVVIAEKITFLASKQDENDLGKGEI